MSNQMIKITVYFLLGIFMLNLFSNIAASELLAAEAGGTPAPLNKGCPG
ncbi:MAG: hypothetical protein SCH70_11470 [Candidatus Methanoperedens sp.]|nr:hypothetical protein [Candidatus Methanoperedens sp.]